MYCTKCGTNNEDNNTFCKNCGAKLVKPANSSPVSSASSSSGVAQAAKAVNVKLIAGIAAALIVVVVVVGVLMNVGKGGKTLFEQIEFGKTTAADVKEYFNKNNLDWDWGVVDELLDVPSLLAESLVGQETLKYLIESCKREGSDIDTVIDEALSNDGIIYISDDTFITADELTQHARNSILHHNINLQDTLWGAGCRYFLPVLGDADDKDKKRAVSSMFCVVDVRDKSAEREFKEGLDKYIKRHQNTNLESRYFDYEHDDIHLIIYPLEKTTINGEKSLTCLVYDYSNLERNGYIFMKLCYESYFTENELKNIMSEVTPYDDEYFCMPGYNYHNQYVGWYFGFTLNEMYPEFCEEELKQISEEMPDFECSIETYTINEGSSYREEKCIVIELCKSDKSDITIPESINGYPVKRIEDAAISGCSNLKSIKIPDSVENIGAGAFEYCSSLKEIELPSGITEIKDNTFLGCISLTDVKIPSSVTAIGDRVFENCGSLVNINIDNNITVIADNAFDGCDILVCEELNVRFPNAVPKPAWLEAYKKFMKDNENPVYLLGADKNGVPCIVTVNDLGSWSGALCHYNGIEVETLTWLCGVSYSSSTNKAIIWNHVLNDEQCALEDLYTATEEMSCYYYEDVESGIVTYRVNDNEVSKDEYNRVSFEIDNRMKSGGYQSIEPEDYYSTIDEAFQAYMSNRGSISASGSVSAANASESAGTAISNNASASEYILKDSSSRYLTKDDLQGLSADECRLARNEIYARHGRKFDDEGLQSHFNSCSWYQGTIAPSDFDETMLNDIEVANKNLIVEYENEKGYR